MFLRNASPPIFPSILAFFVTLSLGSVLRIAVERLSGERPALRAWRGVTGTLALAVAAGAIPLTTWYVAQPILGGGDEEVIRELANARGRSCAEVALWGAILSALVALACAAVRAEIGGWKIRRETYTVVLDALLVFAWSALVRFAFTQSNILTEGGSGYNRLKRYIIGFGGMSVLVASFFPDGANFMWTALRVPSFLAACLPPFLVLLAHSLGLSRGAAAISGVVVASLPVHAAMYSSDLEMGALISLQVLGLTMIHASHRRAWDEWAFAGCALLAYTCWVRPDAPIIGAMAGVIALPGLRRWQSRPALIAGLAWFGVSALTSLASCSAGGAASTIRASSFSFPEFPLSTFLRLPEILPFWFWMPLPLGVASLAVRHRWPLFLSLLGTTVGLIPLSLSPRAGDLSQSYIEYFRYGSYTLPWLALLAAQGWELVVQVFGGILPGRSITRWSPATHRKGVRTLVIGVCVSTAVLAQPYLARRYGAATEEQAFREALSIIPRRCGVIVPEEKGGSHSVEINARYAHIAEEASRSEQATISGEQVLGLHEFERESGGGELPVVRRRHQQPAGGAPCWYYFHGSYCYTGLFGNPPGDCAALERRLILEPVFSQDILYLSYRLVTRPDLRDPPLYNPAQTLVLYRVKGFRQDGRLD